MNILFLDIDGVLITEWSSSQNRDKWFKDYAKPFSPESVKVMNEILHNFDFQIVLTSDWKYVFNKQHLKEFFEFNTIFSAPIPMPYDYRVEFKNDNQYPNYKELRRSKEIQTYIDEYKPDKYIIIDDLELIGFAGNFIKTDLKLGLTLKDLDKINAIMGESDNV